MRRIPEDIPDPDRPGDDITADSMAVAEAKSKDCTRCDSDGWATTYHKNYTGEAIIRAFNGRVEKLKAMRSVSYCVCAAGRKKNGVLQHRRTPKMHTREDC